MAQYDTVVKQVTDDITVTISKKKGATAGEKLVAFLKWVSEHVVDPDYDIGIERPDNSLPGSQPRPDNTLPGGGKPGQGRPDNSLPGAQPRPDNELPGSQPKPDNTLPGGGKPGQGRPDNTLPGAQPKPDNTLPGDQPYPDNGLPDFLGKHAEQIAKLILGKCMDCKDDTAQPK